METMGKLSEDYLLTKDKEKRRRLGDEMEKLEVEFSEAHDQAQEYLTIARKNATKDTRRRRVKESVAWKSVETSAVKLEFKGSNKAQSCVEKSTESYSAPSLGQDMEKQLKRVSIPRFYGDKSLYGSWETASVACVDKVPATPEYKLPQLRQYLSGESL